MVVFFINKRTLRPYKELFNILLQHKKAIPLAKIIIDLARTEAKTKKRTKELWPLYPTAGMICFHAKPETLKAFISDAQRYIDSLD